MPLERVLIGDFEFGTGNTLGEEGAFFLENEKNVDFCFLYLSKHAG